jgi:alkaline phosphatase D
MPLRRQILLAGTAPWFVRHARAADVPRFGLGVASGQPHAGGMVLWTRLTGERLPPRADVRWELAHDERFDQVVARGDEVADAGWAHSVHAEPDGLEPGRWYWYRFHALGQTSRIGRTRSAPAVDAPATLRLAIASCQRWDHGHYAAWRHLATQDLDAVAFLGDYIYEYPSLPTALRPHRGGLLRSLDQFRDRYAQYKSDPALQDAHAACPWWLVWDDHEVENDYAGSHPRTPLGADMATLRAAAYQACWEHLPFSRAQRPRGPDMRISARIDWGRLARIHLLDGRQFRDVQACPPWPRSSGSNRVTRSDCPALDDPSRSLLGPAQERWLDEGWSRDRPWNLLAQQTLMARFAAPRGPGEATLWTDGWDGYPAARRRLLDGVARRQVPGVVVLGGDVHANVVAELRQDADDPRSPVLASEFCGTSISSRGRAQRLLDLARDHNPHLLHARADQRGYVDFTVTPQLMQARLMTVTNPLHPDSDVRPTERFVVDAARPGPQRA